jgi:hypothetical protein
MNFNFMGYCNELLELERTPAAAWMKSHAAGSGLSRVWAGRISVAAETNNRRDLKCVRQAHE